MSTNGIRRDIQWPFSQSNADIHAWGGIILVIRSLSDGIWCDIRQVVPVLDEAKPSPNTGTTCRISHRISVTKWPDNEFIPPKTFFYHFFLPLCLIFPINNRRKGQGNANEDMILLTSDKGDNITRCLLTGYGVISSDLSANQMPTFMLEVG